MDDWNKENAWEQLGIHIDQLIGEVDRILHEIIDAEMGKRGAAYGIIREYCDLPEEPPTWIIKIEDSRTVLTYDTLFQYMSRHENLEDALTRFMRDHFPYFT
ncbi:hypothetical protein [Paenibacillus jiagnxiensis]|uniref:hypothetical protein n=1 Tax=Paenibacillus jiagnxiensis TaxID=3228926 RepID=UPI0033A1E257